MRVIIVIDENDPLKPLVFSNVLALLDDMKQRGIVFPEGELRALVTALASGGSWADKTTYYGSVEVRGDDAVETID